MTKKHFQIIANALLASKPEEHWDANKKLQWEMDVKYITIALANTNPRFDPDRFIAACKGEK